MCLYLVGTEPLQITLSNVFREFLILSFELCNVCIKMLAAFRHVYVVGSPAQKRHCNTEQEVLCSDRVRSDVHHSCQLAFLRAKPSLLTRLARHVAGPVKRCAEPFFLKVIGTKVPCVPKMRSRARLKSYVCTVTFKKSARQLSVDSKGRRVDCAKKSRGRTGPHAPPLHRRPRSGLQS